MTDASAGTPATALTVATRRKPRNAIATANAKSNEDFLRDFIQPSDECWPTWRHPKTGVEYTLSLVQPRDMTETELDACFGLIEKTSGDDYRASSVGWHPAAKKKEMRLPDLRYILVKDGNDDHDDHDNNAQVRGFTSLMPTYENGEPVVYCYEIHLDDTLQGTGLGRQLMGFLTAAAAAIPSVEKAMLTCFVCNARARAFYEGLGFGLDESSPRERRLRGGKTVVPDYVILSRRTARRAARGRGGGPVIIGGGDHGGEKERAGEDGVADR
ncbi:acetyltransferase [Purpureocillium lavendulum]|uniref:N-alpha-acetyltransferase 40 n=1 Tax=Purpureocillium lavendulum TaxID=1247861 RepID=A0AB34FX59_9HYPO|nr:acetyltransferase [Purpureocillium lavendulum]